MTEIERVWERLKERAVRHAQNGDSPSMSDALNIASSICTEECRERPGADAIQYFAAELIRLTMEADGLSKSMHDGEHTGRE